MPKVNDLNAFYHVVNEGFADELAEDGTAGDGVGKHLTYLASSGGAQTARTFSDTAHRFGPLAPGIWQATVEDNTSPGGVPIFVCSFALGGSTIVASATQSARVVFESTQIYIPAIVGGSAAHGGTVLGSFKFEITQDQRYISLVCATATTLQVGFRLLRAT